MDEKLSTKDRRAEYIGAMDKKLIQSLWDRFDKSDAVELVFETGEVKLSLKKAQPDREIIYVGGPGTTLPAGCAAAAFTAEGAQQAGNAAAGTAVYQGAAYPGATYRGAAAYPNTAAYNEASAVSAATAAMTAAASSDADHSAASAAGAETAGSKASASDNSGVYVRSPLPGTFYRASSPDAEPYVMIGKQIKKGAVIGIVESMKMMNEITSQEDGTVAEILAEDGVMVGFDEKLIRLES